MEIVDTTMKTQYAALIGLARRLSTSDKLKHKKSKGGSVFA